MATAAPVVTLDDLDRDPIAGEASYQAAKAAAGRWRNRADEYAETARRARQEADAAEKAMDYCHAAAQCLEADMDRYNAANP